MAPDVPLLLTLDGISAALTLVLLLFFLRLWRATRDPLHLLLAYAWRLAGLALLLAALRSPRLASSAGGAAHAPA